MSQLLKHVLGEIQLLSFAVSDCPAKHKPQAEQLSATTQRLKHIVTTNVTELINARGEADVSVQNIIPLLIEIHNSLLEAKSILTSLRNPPNLLIEQQNVLFLAASNKTLNSQVDALIQSVNVNAAAEISRTLDIIIQLGVAHNELYYLTNNFEVNNTLTSLYTLLNQARQSPEIFNEPQYVSLLNVINEIARDMLAVLQVIKQEPAQIHKSLETLSKMNRALYERMDQFRLTMEAAQAQKAKNAAPVYGSPWTHANLPPAQFNPVVRPFNNNNNMVNTVNNMVNTVAMPFRPPTVATAVVNPPPVAAAVVNVPLVTKNNAGFKSKPYKEWSMDDVVSWLQTLDVAPETVDVFRQQRIKGKFLPSYHQENKLAEIGVKAAGDRLEIIDGISQICGADLPQKSFSPPVSPPVASAAQSSRPGSATAIAVAPPAQVQDQVPRSLTIPRVSVMLTQQMGNCAFGQKWKATYYNIIVFVKKSIQELKGEDLMLLQKEAALMLNLPIHLNVNTLYGICIEPGPSLIVREFCDHGDAASYVRQSMRVDPAMIVRWAIDVATGMEHVCRYNIVHMNIVGSNILLKSHPSGIVAQISDFEMAKEMDGSLASEYIPITHTPPETFESKQYTTKSDVWQFGVTIWQLFSRSKPYEDISMTEIPQAVKRGRLPATAPPPSCSELVYDVLKSCWHIQPANRPTFESVVIDLRKAIS